MSRHKGNISQEILLRLKKSKDLAISGQGSRFWREVYPRLFGKKAGQLDSRKIKDAFYYLKKKRLITGEVKDNQIHVRLSPAGEREAAVCQINRLQIKRSERWDGRWHLLMVNLTSVEPAKRTRVLRQIKNLGFYALTRHVWVFPFSCNKEIKLLREFFQLKTQNLRLAEVSLLEEDQFLQEFFKLRQLNSSRGKKQ